MFEILSNKVDQVITENQKIIINEKDFSPNNLEKVQNANDLRSKIKLANEKCNITKKENENAKEKENINNNSTEKEDENNKINANAKEKENINNNATEKEDENTNNNAKEKENINNNATEKENKNTNNNANEKENINNSDETIERKNESVDINNNISTNNNIQANDINTIVKNENQQSNSQNINSYNNLETKKIPLDEWKKIKNRLWNKLVTSVRDDFSTDTMTKAILDVINVFSPVEIKDFKESFDNDLIPKFVMNFFHISSIENVKISASNSNKEIEANIRHVIKFLQNKNEKFSILYFSENRYWNERYSYTFYSNFIRSFFLKNTKEELFNRCAKIFCIFDDLCITDLQNMAIYIFLIQFISKGVLHLDIPYSYYEIYENYKYIIPENQVLTLFKNAKVPLILNNLILYYDMQITPMPIYYQLQFIFDALDSGPPSPLIVEFFLKAIYSFKHIKIPNFKQLSQTMKSKSYSLKLIKEKTLNYQNLQQNIENKNVTCKEKKIIKIGKLFSERQNNEEKEKEEEEEEENTQLNVKSLISKLNKNNEILEKHILDIKYRNLDQFDGEEHQDKYNGIFNPYLKKESTEYEIIDGILCDTKRIQSTIKESQEKWINEFLNIKKEITNENDTNENSFKNVYNNFPSKLYKIFYYDENDNKWCFDYDIFMEFAIDKKINIKNSKTPVVFFFNSKNEDLITLNSYLIRTQYPQLNENDQNDLFVYALCDNTLSMLNFVFDYTNKDKVAIKPIFLLLHIPKCKEKIQNIRFIITQITSFLCAASDLNVMILNSDYYNEQIQFIKSIQNINEAYVKRYNEIKENPSLLTGTTMNEENNEVNKKDKKEENNEEEEEFVKSYTPHYFIHEQKIICLVNDSTIKYNERIEVNLYKNSFFNSLKSQIKGICRMDYININDLNSYEFFLNSLNGLIYPKCSTFSMVEKNFKNIRQSEISYIYITLKSKNDLYYDELNEMIMETYNIIKSNETDKRDSFSILKILKRKIDTIIPPYDIYFMSDCNSILYKLKQGKNHFDSIFLKSELKKSAETHLNFLKESLNKKEILTKKEMAIISNAHNLIVEEEYFNIIKYKVSPKDINMIFEDNYSVFQDQIKNDKLILDEMFRPFLDRINRKNEILRQDIRDDLNKKTDYSMKETENLREIRVNVQIGQDLKSEIEQDF